MSNITADKIKALRDKTGAGMMDCKKALVENSGSIEESISWLRKKGIANAEKKSSRTASEGIVGLISNQNLGTLIEVNTETDFVSKNDDFQSFVNDILKIANYKEYTLENFLNEAYDNSFSIGEALKNLIAKIGENIVIRRIDYIANNDTSSKYTFGTYVHNKINNDLGKIGSIVQIKSEYTNNEIQILANKVAMHVAASKPLALEDSFLDINFINREKEIYVEQLKSSGKTEHMIEKIVDGKIKKFLSEVILLKQNWILEPSLSVSQVISNYNKDNNTNISIENYKFYVLGEGIEVEEKNFSEEVASQISNTS